LEGAFAVITGEFKFSPVGDVQAFNEINIINAFAYDRDPVTSTYVKIVLEILVTLYPRHRQDQRANKPLVLYNSQSSLQGRLRVIKNQWFIGSLI
jgi:hypothetical protein